MDNLDDLAYARCKACNAQFYPKWRPRLKEFESLCPTCIQAASMVDYYDSDEEYIQSIIDVEVDYDREY